MSSIGVDFEIRFSSLSVPLTEAEQTVGVMTGRRLDDMGLNFPNSVWNRTDAAPVQIGIDQHLQTLNVTAPMTDPNDGTVSFTFPPMWTPRAGRYEFRIYGKKSFCPEDNGTTTPCGAYYADGT
eukprot:COSAG01_NODE_26655_length_707_cov_0.708882_1_plen_123_part_10